MPQRQTVEKGGDTPVPDRFRLSLGVEKKGLTSRVLVCDYLCKSVCVCEMGLLTAAEREGHF